VAKCFLEALYLGASAMILFDQLCPTHGPHAA